MIEADLAELEGNHRLYFLDVSDATPLRTYGHFVSQNGRTVELPFPKALTIERCGDEIILWHWDSRGEQQSHSHMETIEDAMDWTEDVFGQTPTFWTELR